MKFGKQLARHQIQRWSEFYVDYAGLKRSLRRLVDETPEAHSVDGKPTKCHQTWLREVQVNIDRVNSFFESVASELEERAGAAEEELQDTRHSGAELHVAHLQNLVRSLQSTLADLGNFGAANYTALYKIFKKFDKNTGAQVLPRALEQIHHQPFHDEGKVRLEKLQERLDALAHKLDIDVADSLDGPLSTRNLWHVARFAFSLGVISTALIVLAVLSGMDPQNEEYSCEALSAVVPVFRLCFMANLAVWLAGACACIFEQFGINYLFLLDISPEHEIPSMALLNFASFQTGVWILLFFAFLADVKFNAIMHFSGFRGNDHMCWLAHTYIVTLIGAQVTPCLVAAPTSIRFVSLMGRVCFFHFSAVSFVENISADFLTSCSRPLKDLAYTVCYLRQRSSMSLIETRSVCKNPHGLAAGGLQLILVFPLLVRISQCMRRIHYTGAWMPHFLNLWKYLAAVLVTALAGFDLEGTGWFSEHHVTLIRVGAYVIATLYACIWDLSMDFGLTQDKRRRLYPQKAYPIIALLNVLLRSTWSLTYLPDCRAFVKESAFNSECFTFVISALELCRRALWILLRLEHEHLSNAGRFRSVCWVPPLTQPRPKPNAGAESIDSLLKVSPTGAQSLHRLLKKVKVVSLLGSGMAKVDKPAHDDMPPMRLSSKGQVVVERDAHDSTNVSSEEDDGGRCCRRLSAPAELAPDAKLERSWLQDDSAAVVASNAEPVDLERALDTERADPWGRSTSVEESERIRLELQEYSGLLPERRSLMITRGKFPYVKQEEDSPRGESLAKMSRSKTLGTHRARAVPNRHAVDDI
mmetsp:Transcript_21760/g.39995  ORF Transcript_21760/g.39995 Transcript_21760/m.39995 type:complete len:812 (-) Transcript_21760:37-2472(-)